MRIILILLPIIFLYSCKSDNKMQVVKQLNDSVKGYNLCDSLINLEWDTTIYSAQKHLKPGQYFKFLDGLNFDSGEWIAVIKIDHGFRWTWTDSNYFSKKGYYILTDKNILKSIQNSWTAKYLGVDCCTEDFCIYFIRNKKFVLATGMISDGVEGFQNSIYGFTPIKEGNTFKEFYKYFRPCNLDNDKLSGFRLKKTSP